MQLLPSRHSLPQQAKPFTPQHSWVAVTQLATEPPSQRWQSAEVLQAGMQYESTPPTGTQL
jgi:hypothetical protein